MSGRISFVYSVPVRISADDRYVVLSAKDRFFAYTEKFIEKVKNVSLERVDENLLDMLPSWAKFLVEETGIYSMDNRVKITEPPEDTAFGGWGLVLDTVKCMVLRLPVKWRVDKEKGDDDQLLLVWRSDKHPGRGLILTPNQLEFVWRNRVSFNDKRCRLIIEYRRPITVFLAFTIQVGGGS